MGHERSLDPLQSRMAVVVQEVEEADCSGVAFGRDPRDPQADCAIIAREMAIPCVNGIAAAVELLEDGAIVTVDGHLGIVTVGSPEFDLGLW